MSLRIQTLGSFAVFRGDTVVPEAEFKTQKVRDLLKILLTFRGHGLTKDQLCEWLWPNLDPEAAGRSLRVAISHARRALEPDWTRGSGAGFVLTTEAGYAWNPNAEYSLDSEQFEKLAGVALERDRRLAPQETLRQLEAALRLYLGDYLEEDRYADWAATRREELRELRFVVGIRLAELAAQLGRYGQAIAQCRHILAVDTCRESVWCQLMLYHYHAGERSLALRAFQECRAALASELGVEPLAETVALFDKIRLDTMRARGDYPPERITLDAFRPAVSLGALPFVGRERDVAWLVDRWGAARSDGGRVAVIEGEAGIGKSRLFQEFLGFVREQGTLVLVGRGHELEGALPFQPIVDAFRSRPAESLAACRDVDPVWRAELSRLLPEWGDERDDTTRSPGEPGRLFEALTRCLLALASRPRGRSGLIFAIDDLHWADRVTVRFLAYAAHRLGQLPILILGTVRPEEIDPPRLLHRSLEDLDHARLLDVLRLQPLTRDAVTLLVRRSSPSSQSAGAMAEHLYRESRGHPLFLVSLLASLFEDGIFYVDAEGTWDYHPASIDTSDPTAPVPARVIDVIQSRVRRLDAETRRLLELAAVIGRPFDLELARRAGGSAEERVVEVLDRAVDRRLLRPIDDPRGPRYELAHDLIRRAVYQSALKDRRALLHRAVLSALERAPMAQNVERVGELAHHAFRGQVWESAVRYHTRAAEVALNRFALQEAKRLCERGLDALDALEARGEPADEPQCLVWRYDLVAAAQLATHLLGTRDRALLDQLLELARRIRDPERLAQAYYALMRHQIDTGHNQSALALVPEYAEVVRRGVAPLLAIGFHQRVGFLYYRTGDLARALDHHDEALHLALEHHDRHQEAVVRNTRGTVLKCLGRYQEAIDDFSIAAELWEAPDKRLQHTFALDNRGDVLYVLGRYAESLRAQEAAIDIYREFIYPIAEAECLADIGACLHALGRADEARVTLQQALTLSEAIHDAHDLVRSLNCLARLHLDQSCPADWQLATSYADRAVTEAERADLPHGLVQGLAMGAAARLRSGQVAAALECSSRAVALLDAMRHIEGAEEEIYSVHSQALAASGRTDDARRALACARECVATKAAWLTEPSLRRSFLEQVPLNRQLVAGSGPLRLAV